MKKKDHLQSLWRRQGYTYVIGFNAYLPYKMQEKNDHLWEKYIIDETLKRDVFKPYDRVKLIMLMMDQCIDFNEMNRENAVGEIVPLHNNYLLYGTKFAPKSKTLSKLKTKFSFEGNESKGTRLEGAFLEHDTVSLKKAWNKVLFVPYLEIRNYFGEQIAFYFSFLGHYTRFLIFPAVIGIPAWLISIFLKDTHIVYKCFVVIYSFTLIIWAAIFLQTWTR